MLNLHPKVQAAGIGGVLAAVLLAVLGHLNVASLSPLWGELVTAAIAFLSGYAKRA